MMNLSVDDLLMVVPLTALLILCFSFFFTRDFLVDILSLALFSFFSCFFYVIVDGPDVALTESAASAGVSTVILLLTVLLTHRQDIRPFSRTSFISGFFASILIFTCFCLLLYGVLDMVPYGDPLGYAINYNAPYYLETSDAMYHIPNVVTMVLGSFRGFDTMGETVVIFTAAVTTLSLLLGLRYVQKGTHHD